MATQLAERRVHPVVAFQQALSKNSAQLKMTLPSHITPEKFIRVAVVAVQTNPDLLNPEKCDRNSLYTALNKSAADGLLPDGREGAIVLFSGKAQWMPMVAGIQKKVRNSGEISTWDAFPVFEKDKFQRLLGDDMRIYHEPYEGEDPGEVTGAYSIVTFKDGTKSKDYLPRWRIERARNQSRAKNSLQWTVFYDEGAVKTVMKHHAKRLPQSTDVEAAFARDDLTGPATYADTVEHAPHDEHEHDPQPVSRLDALEQQIEHDDTPDPADAGLIEAE